MTFEEFKLILGQPWVQQLIASLALLIVLMALRGIVTRWIRRQHSLATEQRRRLMVIARNTTVILLLLGLIVIWASELQSLALSLAAFAVATVIALTGILQCLLGSLVRGSTKSFEVGDRIELAGFRGDVIDHSLLTTTLLEIGPAPHAHQYTGRAVIFPNNQLLTTTVINESFTDKYVLHHFTIPLSKEEDWEQHERWLLDAAREASASYLADAKQYLIRMSNRYSIEPPWLDPFVTLILPEPGRRDLLLRLPAPTPDKGKIEQDIVRLYLRQAGVAAAEAKPPAATE